MCGKIGRLAWLAGAVFLSACVGTGAASRGSTPTYNDCIFASTLSDWRPLDNQNLILFANGRRPFLVELFQPAPELNFNEMIGVYDRDGRICPYGGDAIVLRGGIPQSVSIRSIRRLTDAQLDAVYAEFGITPPAIIDIAPTELPDSDQ